MIAISKGKFATPRSSRKEEQELEQAFRQVTMAANGESPDDGRDRSSNYYAETIIIPSREAGASQAKKPPAKKSAAKAKSGGTFAAAPGKRKSGGAFAAAPSRKNTRRRNRTIAIVSVSAVVAVLILCISIGLWFYIASTADDGMIMDNTYVAGVNIGGMSPKQAAAHLHGKLDPILQSQSITVKLPDNSLELTTADTQVKLDIELLVKDAYNYGRTGSRSDRIAAMAEAALTRRDMGLLSYMTMDTSSIKEALNQLLADSNGTLTQPTVQLEGTRPTAPNPENPEDISKVYQTLTVVLGTPGIGFDTEQVYNQILDAYNNLDFTPIEADFTTMEPDPVDLAALAREYCTEPVDAILDESDFTFTDEIWGYGFNEEAAGNLLKAAGPGDTVTLSLTYLKPEHTREDLENTLFKDVLASADTIYYLDPPRTNNLILACQAINNYIVKPGEAFSFNEVLGERTAEKGYQEAGAYADGETVEQLGGGICQVASTLYYCTLYADLYIIEREEHMFTADYLPLGMDATVNWGTLDFRFRNNTDHPILIQANADNDYVTVTLRGTDDKDYYVEMDYVILEEYQWETVERVLEEDNEDGYVDGEVIYNGWMGYSVDTYKYKYDKVTDELLYCEIESHSEYSKRDKTICKINNPEEDTSETEENIDDSDSDYADE